jgi:hypothetical protein
MKLTLQAHMILFLFGCFGIRLLFAYIAKIVNVKLLPYLGILGMIPVLGWLYIIFINPRDTSIEAGGKIWWKSLRKYHVLLYIIFVFLALNKNKKSYIPLLVDAIFGLIAVVLYRL